MCALMKSSVDNLRMKRQFMYAVRPYHWKDKYPKINEVAPGYAEEVRRKWEGKLKFLQG